MLVPNVSSSENIQELAKLRNNYKLLALVDVLIEKEYITKNEMNKKYIELINSVSYAIDGDDFKRELIKPLYPTE